MHLLDDYKIFKNYVPASFRQMQALRSGQVYIVSEKAWGMTQIRRQRVTDLGRTPAFVPRQSGARPSKIKQLRLPLEVNR